MAVWDGITTAHVGGTGHTIAVALEQGAPVVWIDPANPGDWRILQASEALAGSPPVIDAAGRAAVLGNLIHAALDPGADPLHPGFTALSDERWHSHSNGLTHAYRRVEALFGGGSLRQRFRRLRQRYEAPGDFTGSTGHPFLEKAAALSGADGGLVTRIRQDIMFRFAWADGVSAHLSDACRGGMTFNFVLSCLAIVAGIAYLPFVPPEHKWFFALTELLLLCGILLITVIGQRRNLHTRWFETRRVAEYLRHAPLMTILGSGAPPVDGRMVPTSAGRNSMSGRCCAMLACHAWQSRRTICAAC
ncbi:MAG: hypothetical protein JSR96_03135 [Proteobacteria bacterium]|nr:hypothetical protein [Pseudomonadota bacterium]